MVAGGAGLETAPGCGVGGACVELNAEVAVGFGAAAPGWAGG